MSEVLTMAQMAKELNVSQRVVSAVVNDKTAKLRVGLSTQERIRLYLDQRGYVQSKSALQVKNGGGQDTVGILYCGKFVRYSYLIETLSFLSEAIEDKFGFVEILGISPDKIRHGLREQVSKGIKRLIWIHDNSPKEEIKNAQQLFPLLSRMDKVVIYNYGYMQSKVEQAYLDNGIDLVGFNRSITYARTAELFKELGHRKIALDESLFDNPHLGPRGPSTVKPVFEKYGFDVYGLCPDNVFDIPHNELAVLLAEKLIYHYQQHQVDCVFIRNDIMGNAIINILTSKGIRVPQDIALIGFGDIPLAEFQAIAMSTFKHPVKKMCDKTMELINKKSSATGKKYSFKDKFIARKSHKKNVAQPSRL